MVDKYTPPGAFADISAFVADSNAINSATKTALNTALANIAGLITQAGNTGSGFQSAAHPDFNKIDPATAAKLINELTVLAAAVTAHA